jgi:DNA-binding transcriptional regulator GbsR (MarR family)
MNLRELMSWGVVRKLHRPGERRELYRAEADVWTLFQRIMAERKRRELDPTVKVLDDLALASVVDPRLRDLQGRVETLRNLLGAIDGLSTRLMELDSGDLAEFSKLLSDDLGDEPI